MERDAEGRVTGTGMTLSPTPHRVDAGGHNIYAWCAADALGILPAIGRTVQITSACRETGQAVSVTAGPEGVRDIRPPQAVVSTLITADPDDIRGSLCDLRAGTPHQGARRARRLLTPQRSGSGRSAHPPGATRCTTEHGSNAGLAEFLARLDWANAAEPVTFGFAVIGLTNFGERPLEISRLAAVLDMPVSEAEARARKYGMAGKEGSGGFGTRAENGIITVSPDRAKPAPRRWLRIGDRRLGVTGCAPDIFLYAPLVRPSLQVEETCPVTGTPIRLAFTPGRVESVEPAGAVLPLPGPRSPLYSCADAASNGEQIDADACDASLCSQAPLLSSAGAAQGWLAAHPGGRVFPVREAWELSAYRDYRDRMSALLGLGS